MAIYRGYGTTGSATEEENNQGVTAFSWGNHALAGYLTSAGIGTTIQAFSNNLSEFATVNPTPAGLALLDDVSASAQRTTLGLAIDNDVQAYNANLTTYGTVAPTSFGLALLDDLSVAAQRTTLGLTIGTDVQAYDVDTTKNDVVNTFTANQIIQANLGIGVTSPTAYLELKAGTATASTAPIKLTTGVNLTTPEVGAIEYDGDVMYFTSNTTSGRGYIPSTQIFRLTANGTAFGATIGNFFGTNSAINLDANGEYEIEAYCYFTKTTAGTVIVTATTSVAPTNLNGVVTHGANAGGTAHNTAQQISLFNSTSTASAFGASGSLSGAEHLFIIKLIVDVGASTTNLRINFTQSAGTVTPLRGSYYKVTKLPIGNSGNFVA